MQGREFVILVVPVFVHHHVEQDSVFTGLVRVPQVLKHEVEVIIVDEQTTVFAGANVFDHLLFGRDGDPYYFFLGGGGGGNYCCFRVNILVFVFDLLCVRIYSLPVKGRMDKCVTWEDIACQMVSQARKTGCS